jgi:PLD-like domain
MAGRSTTFNVASWEVARSQGKIMERNGCLLELAVVATLVLTGAASGGELRACFTPGQNCTALIVEQINAARSELLVQAYGFTSPEIIQAIGRAKERGVDVNIILDRVNEQDRYTGATYLLNHGIDPLIDDRGQMRDLRRHIDRVGPALQRIEEIRKTLPFPGQALSKHDCFRWPDGKSYDERKYSDSGH